MIKKVFAFTSALTLAVTSLLLFYPQATQAAFTANHLMDDSVFDDSSSMDASQIDIWLNTFGSSCISPNSGFTAVDPTGYTPGGGFTYGSPVTAGRVIYDSARVYGVNPKVLLVTLQKEQSLVSGGAGCSVLRYTGAMGYGCPDGGTTYSYSGLNPALYYTHGSPVTSVSGTCVNTAAKAGFSQQVIRGAWLLAFGRQRSEGNTPWNVQLPGWDNSDDPQTCYSGPMTQGYRKRCSSDSSAVYYDGYTTIDGQSTHMDTGATATFYWYTPHFAGNQNFYNLFTSWFGDPNTPCFSTGNVGGAVNGPKMVTYNSAGVDYLSYSQQNNTGTACVELHLERSGFQNWALHVATAMRSADPSQGTLIPATSAIDHQSSLNYIVYSGGGGHVEVHRMSPDLRKFPGYYDVPTDLTGITPSVGMFVAGDFFGRGYDQLAFVIYSGGGGHVEVHLFDPTLQHAIGYYDIQTDLVGISSTTGTFVAGDFLGRGYDQLAFVIYSGGGGHVEVHLFDPTLRHAIGFYDMPTDLVGIGSTTGTFIAGDFLGRHYSQLLYVLYDNGSGRVETHMFNPSLSKAIGYQDIITNIASFDPGS